MELKGNSSFLSLGTVIYTLQAMSHIPDIKCYGTGVGFCKDYSHCDIEVTNADALRGGSNIPQFTPFE